jgi:hypothetical protein
MVHLATTASAFQARVLAARLGSEGIVVSLRGAVDGPYPFGECFVLVDAESEALARQLLLADEVESVFSEPTWPTPRALVQRPWAAVLAMVLVTVASTLARIVSL